MNMNLKRKNRILSTLILFSMLITGIAPLISGIQEVKAANKTGKVSVTVDQNQIYKTPNMGTLRAKKEFSDTVHEQHKYGSVSAAEGKALYYLDQKIEDNSKAYTFFGIKSRYIKSKYNSVDDTFSPRVSEFSMNLKSAPNLAEFASGGIKLTVPDVGTGHYTEFEGNKYKLNLVIKPQIQPDGKIKFSNSTYGTDVNKVNGNKTTVLSKTVNLQDFTSATGTMKVNKNEVTYNKNIPIDINLNKINWTPKMEFKLTNTTNGKIVTINFTDLSQTKLNGKEIALVLDEAGGKHYLLTNIGGNLRKVNFSSPMYIEPGDDLKLEMSVYQPSGSKAVTVTENLKNPKSISTQNRLHNYTENHINNNIKMNGNLVGTVDSSEFVSYIKFPKNFNLPDLQFTPGQVDKESLHLNNDNLKWHKYKYKGKIHYIMHLPYKLVTSSKKGTIDIDNENWEIEVTNNYPEYAIKHEKGNSSIIILTTQTDENFKLEDYVILPSLTELGLKKEVDTLDEGNKLSTNSTKLNNAVKFGKNTADEGTPHKDKKNDNVYLLRTPANTADKEYKQLGVNSKGQVVEVGVTEYAGIKPMVKIPANTQMNNTKGNANYLKLFEGTGKVSEAISLNETIKVPSGWNPDLNYEFYVFSVPGDSSSVYLLSKDIIAYRSLTWDSLGDNNNYKTSPLRYNLNINEDSGHWFNSKEFSKFRGDIEPKEYKDGYHPEHKGVKYILPEKLTQIMKPIKYEVNKNEALWQPKRPLETIQTLDQIPIGAEILVTGGSEVERFIKVGNSEDKEYGTVLQRKNVIPERISQSQSNSEYYNTDFHKKLMIGNNSYWNKLPEKFKKEVIPFNANKLPSGISEVGKEERNNLKIKLPFYEGKENGNELKKYGLNGLIINSFQYKDNNKNEWNWNDVRIESDILSWKNLDDKVPNMNKTDVVMDPYMPKYAAEEVAYNKVNTKTTQSHGVSGYMKPLLKVNPNLNAAVVGKNKYLLTYNENQLTYGDLSNILKEVKVQGLGTTRPNSRSKVAYLGNNYFVELDDSRYQDENGEFVPLLRDLPEGSVFEVESKYKGKFDRFIILKKELKSGKSEVYFMPEEILTPKEMDGPGSASDARYKEQNSLIRWLNSNKKDWYKDWGLDHSGRPETKSSSYFKEKGFLDRYSEDLVNNLASYGTYTPNSTIAKIDEKVKLLSQKEVRDLKLTENLINIPEGEYYTRLDGNGGGKPLSELRLDTFDFKYDSSFDNGYRSKITYKNANIKSSSKTHIPFIAMKLDGDTEILIQSNGNSRAVLSRKPRINLTTPKVTGNEETVVQIPRKGDIEFKGEVIAYGSKTEKGNTDNVQGYLSVAGKQIKLAGEGKALEKDFSLKLDNNEGKITHNGETIIDQLELDKEYPMKLWAEDNMGLKSSEIAVTFIVPSNTPPQIEIKKGPEDNKFFKASDKIEMEINIKEIDQGQTVSAEYSLVDKDGKEVDKTKVSLIKDTKLEEKGRDFTFNIPLKDLEDGKYQIKIKAEDSGVKLGDEEMKGVTEKYTTFFIDNTPPKIEIKTKVKKAEENEAKSAKELYNGDNKFRMEQTTPNEVKINGVL